MKLGSYLLFEIIYQLRGLGLQFSTLSQMGNVAFPVGKLSVGRLGNGFPIDHYPKDVGKELYQDIAF